LGGLTHLLGLQLLLWRCGQLRVKLEVLRGVLPLCFGRLLIAIWVVGTSGCVLLKLLPVRPNDNEEVDFKGENEDVTESMNPVEGDQIVDQTDQIPDHTDDGQNDPGQHKAGLCLISTVDEEGCNDDIAGADDQEDHCHDQLDINNTFANLFQNNDKIDK